MLRINKEQQRKSLLLCWYKLSCQLALGIPGRKGSIWTHQAHHGERTISYSWPQDCGLGYLIPKNYSTVQQPGDSPLQEASIRPIAQLISPAEPGQYLGLIRAIKSSKKLAGDANGTPNAKSTIRCANLVSISSPGP